ncbi:MAG: choice-of-anchor L domain-containing protein [Bacteroidales bacterium]
MKKLYFFLVFFGLLLGIKGSVIAQALGPDDFKVTPCKTQDEAITLIKNVLLKGLEEEGLISHVKIKGKPEQFGYYENGATLGFKTPTGLVISTGEAKATEGPNVKSNVSQDMECGGDNDCQRLADGDDTYDAAGIEFYFYPAGDLMQFNYVFGSEEYNEFVMDANKRPSLFNDNFGFFLNSEEDDEIVGPFSNKSKNIALVPFKSDYVSVKTIHCGYEEKHKVDPPGKKDPSLGNNCNLLIVNKKSDRKYNQMDGYTVPMTAMHKVTMCKKYRIKMVIADTKDNGYNSVVFFEEGSFDVGNVKTKQVSNNTNVAGTAIRGCNEIAVKFKIPKQLSKDFEIPLSYTTSSGIEIGNHIKKDNDLNYCPDKVIIPQGSVEAESIVSVENDDWDGKYQTVKLSYPTNICNKGKMGSTTVTLKKIDPIIPKVEVTFDKDATESKWEDPKVTLECYKNAYFDASATGGYEPIEFSWEETKDGEVKKEVGKLFTEYGDKPSQVKLIATGKCTSEERVYEVQTGSIALKIEADDETPCLNQNVIITATTNSPLEYIEWSNGEKGVKSITIEAIQDDMEVTCWVPGGCDPAEKQSQKVSLKVIKPEASVDPVEALICPGEKLELKASKGIAYSWEPTNETTQNIIVEPVDGKDEVKYTVTVTDECTNTASATSTVRVKRDVIAKITTDIEDGNAICGGEEVKLHGEGGNSVEWMENGVVLSTERDITVSPQETTTYQLKVTDYCSDITESIVEVNPTPQIALDFEKTADCTPAKLFIRNRTADGFKGGSLEYTWKMDGKEYSTDEDFNITLEEPGVHDLELKVVSDNGCSDEEKMPNRIEAYGHPESDIIHDYEEFLLNREEYYFITETENPKWVYDWLINGPTTSGSSQGKDISYEFKEPGEFNITLNITDENDCSSKYTLNFLVQRITAFAWIPTAFTPNGDGKNDNFYVQTRKKALAEFKLQIFNRWGQRVYETDDPSAKWDGKVNGEYVEPGAYAVKVNITSIEGEKGEQSALVFVIK